MREITTTYIVEPSRGAVCEVLTPRTIVESSELYEIRSHDRTAAREEIVVEFDDTVLRFGFTKRKNGYEYELVGDSDLFEEYHTSVTVVEREETTITATCRYTLDSWLSFVLDRLAASTVETELETMLANIVEKVHQGESSEQ
ncbi:hypothetical protein SAMN04487967_1464 [Natronorubrum sediminis]|uniref:Polyketide cyclase / dehydrase and lipid transport n=1 Tax=Natronorubrum sediminis TaxID=640943 RepID=A0A1H6FT62_9EURY|nr:hypothetical protein [Natronorubrum sediminis]SEH13582.1 hypothetical protein SAMN04487967_1464 [Natronorubrum sediminis]